MPEFPTPSSDSNSADETARKGSSITRRKWLGASAATLVSAACATRATSQSEPQAPARGGSANDLANEVPRLMELASVPGAAVGIITANAAATMGFGTTRASDGAPVTADTVFEAASLSKPVFAYLVHLLVAENKLDLTRPLSSYLDLPNSADSRASTITARHVLSHTSGWRNWRFGPNDHLTADFDPGARFSYSGEGYYFLQRVVEKITGAGILRLTRDKVFTPLGMSRTSYLWSPEFDTSRADPHSGRGVPIDSYGVGLGRKLRAAAAAASTDIDDWKHEDFERMFAAENKDRPPFPNFLTPNVAGSLHTTANDYARFIRHLYGAQGRPILNRMMESQVDIKTSLKWGLGFGLQTGELGATRSRPMFWHWGDNNGFKNIVIGDPSDSSAVIVFANGNGGRQLYERIVRIVRGRDQPAFLWI